MIENINLHAVFYQYFIILASEVCKRCSIKCHDISPLDCTQPLGRLLCCCLFFRMSVLPSHISSVGNAATTTGLIYFRLSDQCRPSKSSICWCPIWVQLYYDGNSETACFAGASFGNSVGKPCKFLWRTRYSMFQSSAHAEGFPREYIWICGSKGVLTSLIITYCTW